MVFVLEDQLYRHIWPQRRQGSSSDRFTDTRRWKAVILNRYCSSWSYITRKMTALSDRGAFREYHHLLQLFLDVFSWDLCHHTISAIIQRIGVIEKVVWSVTLFRRNLLLLVTLSSRKSDFFCLVSATIVKFYCSYGTLRPLNGEAVYLLEDSL